MHNGAVFVASAAGINTFGFSVAAARPPASNASKAAVKGGGPKRATVPAGRVLP
jgi:two-component system heavy metal sensor histidine kinase CusS